MTGERVLVVEDDERSAELIRATLEPTGVRLERGRSLADARQRLSGDGVLIVAVSASVRASDRDLARTCGCDDYIEKPISPRDLVARVRRWEDGRS
jgi:DNA-binding response OmpR family regulator